jgi:hypothetical protein
MRVQMSEYELQVCTHAIVCTYIHYIAACRHATVWVKRSMLLGMQHAYVMKHKVDIDTYLRDILCLWLLGTL